MSLTLVLGPANSAKAGEVLGAFAAAAHRGDALLVVPTALDADHYRRELAEQGTVLGSVLTFAGLVELIARRAGYDARRLSPPARRRALRRVLARLGLEVLAPSAAGAGFASAAAQLVIELERSLITPQRFAAALQAWAAEDERRAPYARELAALPLGYARELERLGCVDRELYAWRALDALRADPGSWGETTVFFYGFDDLLGLERDAVETLARVVGVDVTVSLTYEPGRPALTARAEVVQELRAFAAQVRELPPLQDHYEPDAREVLHHLERGLFEQPPSERIDPGTAVRLLEAGGELAQAELVAAEVLGLRARGIAPREVAVVCRSLARLAPVIGETFTRYGIPVAVERRVPLSYTSLGGALRALVRCAFDPEATAAELVALLRAPGLAPSPESVDALEAEVRRTGLRHAWQAAERWPEPVESVRRLREADDPASELARQARALVSASRAGEAALLDEREELDARALAALLSALAEAQELGERLHARELMELLGDLEVPAGQPGGDDAVLLAEPLAIRARRFAAVIVCGLNEGEFPAAGRAEPFLSDERRWELAAASGLRLPAREDALARERYLFYACASRATAEFVLVYRSSDEEGNLALPSPFIGDVAELFVAPWSGRRTRRLLGDVVWEPEAAPTPRERARAQALGAVQAAASGPVDGPGRRLGEAALGVVRHRDVVSAGALESFAECPVRWLVERQLAPRPLSPDPDPILRGQLMHEVLEQVIGRLEVPLRPETLPDALRILEEVLATLPLPVAPGRSDGVKAAILRGYESDLRRYLAAEARDSCDWRAAGVEVRFGFSVEEGSLPELVLGEPGRQIRLRGVIDRVDVDPESGTRAAVRDYKSGARRPEQVGARWVEDDRLQVALYMLAVRELMGLDPVAGFYQPLAGPDLRPRGVFRRGEPLGSRVVDRDAREPEELDALLSELAERAVALAAQIRSGELIPCPSRCSRDGCRYPGICRSG